MSNVKRMVTLRRICRGTLWVLQHGSPRGHSLISTEDFTSAEVKEIAEKALKEYKRLSLINNLKNPGESLTDNLPSTATSGQIPKKPLCLVKGTIFLNPNNVSLLD